MDDQELGTTGIRVSRIGLGGNNFGLRINRGQTRAVVETALDAGITFFDTADVYGHDGGSERYLGEILAPYRDRIVIATKFGGKPESGFGTAAYVNAAIVSSLERLRTDYVDLYYLHKPDPATPIAETLAALDVLVTEGKVRSIGCSNFGAAQLAEAEHAARELGTARFVVLQNELNLLRRNDEGSVLPLCRELAIGYVPYKPLAVGLLSGKYRPGEPPPYGSRLAGDSIPQDQLDRVVALTRFATDRGQTLLTVALSVLLAIPGVGPVITGATRPDQVRANVDACGWKPSPDDLVALAIL